MSDPPGVFKRRGDIQALRGIAIFAVWIYHLFPQRLPSGFRGVDVFLIISGYVVTLACTRRVNDDTSFGAWIRGFYVRRINRILPALGVAVALTVLGGLIIYDPQTFENFSLYGATALFGMSNIALQLQDVGYFSLGAELNPFLHTWSLGLEEQFYFFFPFIYYFLLRSPLAAIQGRQRSAQSISKQKIELNGLKLGKNSGYGQGKTQLASCMLMLLIVISLGYMVWALGNDVDAAYYSVLSRLWQFGLGVMLCFYEQTNSGHLSSNRAFPAQYWGLVMICISFFLPETPSLYLSVAGTLVCIILGSEKYASVLSNQQALQYVGERSYSYYLYHWPCIVYAKYLLGSSLLWVPLALLSTIILSEASYTLIEKSGLSWKQWLQPFTLYFFASCLALPVLSNHKFSRILQRPFHYDYAWEAWDLNALAGISLKSFATPIDSGQPADLPLNRGGSVDVQSKKEIYLKSHDFIPNNLEANTPTVYAIGDSHAGSLFASLWYLSRYHGLKGVLIAPLEGGGCGLFTYQKRTLKCTKIHRSMVNRLRAQLSTGDILITASLRMPLGSQSQAVKKFYQENPAGYQFTPEEDDIQALVRDVRAKHILMMPWPIYTLGGKQCVGHYRESLNPGCQQSVKEFITNRKPAVERLSIVVRNNDNNYLFDPKSLFCNDSICKMTTNAIPLYMDSHHLTAYSSKALGAMLAEEFMAQRWISKASQAY